MVPQFRATTVQWIVALGMVAFAIASRLLVDLLFPGAAPYAINVPAVLAATLIGRLRAGMITLVLTSIITWYAVVPIQFSFRFLAPSDAPRTLVNIATSLILVLLAEFGRRSFRDLLHEREARIDERDMLLREVDHRVKNNLAVLASLLRLQQRETHHDEVRIALEKAANRVHSLAAAYENLHYDGGDVAVVRLDEFLDRLCRSLAQALAIGDSVRIVVTADRCLLARDRASAVGLFVNEAVTNAVKHAFAARPGGTIRVSLKGDQGHATLTVVDDGVGLPDGDIRDGAKGHKYLEAFATIARARMTSDSDATGTCYTLTLEEMP